MQGYIDDSDLKAKLVALFEVYLQVQISQIKRRNCVSTLPKTTLCPHTRWGASLAKFPCFLQVGLWSSLMRMRRFLTRAAMEHSGEQIFTRSWNHFQICEPYSEPNAHSDTIKHSSEEFCAAMKRLVSP